MNAVTGILHCLEPDFGRKHRVGGEAFAADGQPPMRAGADAHIIPKPPIGEIVPALRARHRVIGHFIGGKACVCAEALRDLIHICARVLIRHHQRAFFMKRVKGRAGLKGQLIKRQVIGGEAQRPREFRFPSLRRLTRPRVDEVKAHARECIACQFIRRERLGHRMQPPQRLEVLVIQRLNADRKPVHPRRPKTRELFRLHGRRVRLEGNFGITRQTPQPIRRTDNHIHRARIHKRRRTAAKKDRCEGAAALQARHMFHLADERSRPERMIDPRHYMRIEIAIGTFGSAERPMHIEPESGCP